MNFVFLFFFRINSAFSLLGDHSTRKYDHIENDYKPSFNEIKYQDQERKRRLSKINKEVDEDTHQNLIKYVLDYM